MDFKLSVITDNWPFLAHGLYLTIAITLGSLVIGMVLGLLIGIMRLSKNSALRWIAMAYISVFRNTPGLVQLVWFYYCLPILTGINLTALWACIIALSAGAGAYIAEIVRAGIQGVDKGQVEAAKTIGLTYVQSLRMVILPQAIRTMLPPLVNEIVTLLKFSSLVSVLGVQDMTYQAQVLSTTTFRPIELYTFLGVQYFVICVLISRAAQRIEIRMSKGV